MIKHYFKIFWRNLLRNRYYSIPSVLGLALGISCTLLIVLYVFDELSYDQFHTKKERIYRISETISHNGEIHAALTSLPIAPQLQQDFPEIESYARFISLGQRLSVKVNNQYYREENFWRVDSSVFEIFDFPLLVGTTSSALSNPRSVVISKKLAEKYFETIENAYNKEILIANSKFTVSGVVDSEAGKSDIEFEAFLPLHGLPPHQIQNLNQDWFRLVAYTFVLTKNPVEPARFNEMFTHLQTEYIQPFVETFGGNSSASFVYTPLTDLHFENSREYDLPKGNKNYLLVFCLVAFFILSIASINHTNLSLSQSVKRAKEVGVRKALGAEKKQIVSQFLGESLLITFLSFVLAISLTELSLPFFNAVTDKNVSLGNFNTFQLVVVLTSLLLFVALLSGSYPAFVLSRFQAVDILRGSLPKLGQFKTVRTAMVGLQFIISMFMVISTYAIYQQMNYIQHKDLGFRKEGIAVINLPQDTAVYRKVEALKQQLEQSPQVASVTGSGGVPGRRAGELMFRVEQEGQLIEKSLKTLFVDEKFFEVFNIELQQGRVFSKDRVTDQEQAFIVNQSAVEALGWGNEPLGKRVQWGLTANNTATNDGKVVGVINDFNFASLHNPIEPLVICYNPYNSSMISVRFNRSNTEENLDYLSSTWKEFAGLHPLEYEFMDDRLNLQYESDFTLFKVGSYFSIISMLIALLGLFSLVSFSVEQRIKEMGIRKVLGASDFNLIQVLSADFMKTILVAALLVAPIAFFTINTWLNEFSYSVGLPYLGFITTLVTVLAISLGIISFHVSMVSNNRPINALRRE